MCLNKMQNKYNTNSDAPDVHFDNFKSLFSDAQTKKVGNPGKKVKTVQKKPIKTLTKSYRIVPNSSNNRSTCMNEGDNPSI